MIHTTMLRIHLRNRPTLLGIRRPDVAQELGFTDSTFSRNLRLEGTTYQTELDRDRLRRLAEHGHRRNTLALARKLGFRELNSFYRWYREQTETNWSDAA